MKIEQIYTGCLAQGAYYIESNGEVAIIDPLREIKPYIEKADEDNAKIKYIFETHFHADFVSGHVTLAKETGADIIFGPSANPSFEATIAKDGQEFRLGEITIIALHTPGHTMESTTYLLKDATGKDHAIFSGDTLFLGDVGRPDLAQKAAHMTQEELAATLYDSLRTKIMPLADDVIVYPAHGAGSACGKNMMKETVDTLGNQKKMNYALRADMTKEEFVKEVTDGLLPPPLYFPLNVKMNKEGYTDIEEVIQKGTRPFSPNDFEALANETGAIVLDVRHQTEYVKGHIPRSIFIGIDGGFAPWVGALIADVQQPILLVTPEGRVEETITRLSRVGFDNTLGYLEGGFEAWKKASKDYDTLTSISALEFKNALEEEGTPVFDVRKESEFTAEHIDDAHNTPLDFINDYLAEFPTDKTFYVHCAGGYRSVIAASILKSRGIHNLIDIAGGFKDIKEVGIKTTDYVCPSTIK
ncbi:glyoxylase-like metal-dependent hydrolase (beta-lactamase superfamily II)/rhodanese-related sulfurtransferase [Aquimarina sp. EL_43]|uniref:MBL fold metallo-hydrolase n=1 Tax=unclassified Aquimarina TaxID=2627091 RepID=UPI0018C8DFDE|nr:MULTISPECIES: MBL fold metallo-hydrolase [unclassified Aquimarina]MBG6131827.1 glyoxylase-like metal-dependent hydrolase (beta-lactamase superfamily II)/rhodanese-related sulfurtransferase [Aquimarina sp. EL_35]MBG6149391.1 glyoxylase-like metal-dependent hydrolase (beta-lactamase superfamily II)/rhodanese-related sulfurtransferase [Aquimarina sp. EL_32]MBG6170346.1 glyoxylase-like metal-dependent hydrolase (beta-lactamase superfamily II)/rhodanese-related sulfurtransferase [Aquimarina sp. EL